jgi:hypothetical protein
MRSSRLPTALKPRGSTEMTNVAQPQSPKEKELQGVLRSGFFPVDRNFLADPGKKVP